MKTKLEQFAVELRSLATGVEGMQGEIDRREDKIDWLTATIEQQKDQIEIIQSAAAEAARKEHWQNPAADPPPLGVKVLVRDKNKVFHIATWEGSAGWFVGDIRLKSAPTRWLLIPER